MTLPSAASRPALEGNVDRSVFQIGAFHVDPSRNLVETGTDHATIEPRVMDVLCTLAERHGEVVTRAELIEQHWGTRFSGDESLTRAISLLRKTFRSAGATKEYIETVPKRGYRLLQPVHGLKARKADDAATPVKPGGSVPLAASTRLPPSYSVAVVPLRSTSDPADELLADDIGHDLVEMLSRTPRLRVAAYAANLKDKLAAMDVREIGQRLEVHYVVSGSLVRDGTSLLLRIELVDAIANRHVLSWKLHQDLDQFLSNLNEFILDICTPILSEIQICEASSAHIRREDDPDAEAIIQSTEMLRAVYCEERAREIVDHLEHLVRRDPDNASAHASLAVQLAQNVVSAWTSSPLDDRVKAGTHIEKALRIAPRDPDVQASAGIVALMMRENEKAVHFLELSLEENPNNPHALAALGFQIGLKNRDEAGIEMIRIAEKRAPHHPRHSIWAHYRANCHLAIGNLEKALKANREAIDRNPNYHLTHILLATTLLLLGRSDEARAAIETALENSPGYGFHDCTALLDTFPELYEKWMTRTQLAHRLREVWPS